ncbi:MAG: hypothetical protein Q8P32_02855 [Candidatus Komeilibacteria bacterium]|nr:hypothetical protein [Candidatus Komeilibacteria bacterium]
MLLIARILSLFSPVAIAGTFALLFLAGSNFYYVVFSSLTIAALSLWALTKLRIKSGEEAGGWFYIWQGLMLTAGFLLLFVFLENNWFKIGLWLMISVTMFFYYNGLFKIFHARFLPEEKMLNWRPLLAGLAVFCLGSGLFGLHDFISFNIWLIVGFVFVMIFFSDWTYRKITAGRAAAVYAGAAALIGAEIFWAIGNLPLVYYLKGLIFSLFYLGLTVSLDSRLNRHWPGSRVKNYLLTIAVLILLILVTARWF